MKTLLIFFGVFFTSGCYAADFQFFHAYRSPNSETASQPIKSEKYKTEIYIQKSAFITSSDIENFSITYMPIHGSSFEYLHALDIRFTEKGRALFNQMISEKKDSDHSLGRISVFLNGHIIFIHNFEPVIQRDGKPDLMMLLNLSDEDYTLLLKEQNQKKAPNQAPQPTTMLVTPPAAQESRQAWSRLI